jgi:hypothetical protein
MDSETMDKVPLTVLLSSAALMHQHLLQLGQELLSDFPILQNIMYLRVNRHHEER